MELTLHFDGACEPTNPGGTGSYGWVVEGLPDPVRRGGVCGSGKGMTNNVAEYTALGKALRWLADRGVAADLTGLLIRGDSKLVVWQLAGEWRCNHEHLRKLRDRCLELLALLGCPWRAEWVPREQNRQADALSVSAWEEATGKPFPHRRK